MASALSAWAVVSTRSSLKTSMPSVVSTTTVVSPNTRYCVSEMDVSHPPGQPLTGTPGGFWLVKV